MITGKFKDINDNLYMVTFDVERNETVEMGATPFVVSYEGDDDDIYKPVKMAQATAQVLTPDYLFNLYTGEAHGVKCTLYRLTDEDDDNPVIKWVGYVSPNLYSQGYELETETLDVECVDGLATLENFRYETDNPDIISVGDLLTKIVEKCECYTGFYISKNIQINGDENRDTFEVIHVNEVNFIDFDNPEDNWTYQEVLTEICQYLGVTAVAYGDSVYFIDYDAIKAGVNDFYYYEAGVMFPRTRTLTNAVDVENTIYQANGSSLSLDPTFNKISVSTDFNTVEDILPDLFDDEKLIPWANNGTIFETARVGNSSATAAFGSKFFNVVWRYYKHENYTNKWYALNTMQPVSELPSYIQQGTPTDTKNFKFSGSTFANYVGSVFLKHQCLSNDSSEANEKIQAAPTLSNYLLLFLNNKRAGYGEKKPLLESNFSNIKTPLMIGGDCYLIFSGSIVIFDRQNCYLCPSSYGEKSDKIVQVPALYCELSIGGKWWNGTSWQSSQTTFNLPTDTKNGDSHHLGVDLKIKNTVDWRYQYFDGQSGYAVAFPKAARNSEISFKIYLSEQVINSSYRTDCIWLKDFSIKAAVGHLYNFDPIDHKTGEKIDETNTTYTNVIDTENVNEGEEREFRICTHNGKKPNYSLTYRLTTGGTMQYLANVYNRATGQNLIPERHFIYKQVTQHTTPAVRISSTLENLFTPWARVTDGCMNDKVFVVDGQEIDYKNNSTEITLVEKM